MSLISGQALLVTALGALALTGCGGSKYMQPLPRTGQIARSAEAATVVFIRPSSYGGSIVPTILDVNGRFVGESLPNSFFTATVPPGEHVFLSWAENTGPLRVRVEAGKMYFVEVSTKPGWMSVRVHLLAITPRSGSWSEVDGWISESTPYAADLPRGQAYLDGRAEDVAERVRRAKDALATLAPEEVAERTIEPGDGR